MSDSQLLYIDLISDTSTTTGTGSLTLIGSSFANNLTSYTSDSLPFSRFKYLVVGGSEWEVGSGKVTTSGTILSRDVVESSSNSNSLVSFSAGTKTISIIISASSINAIATKGKIIATNNSQTLL